MPLRIAFDLDGVLADMESELARHAQTLFGEPMMRRLQELDATSGASATGVPASALEDTASDEAQTPEPAPDSTPPLPKLRLTARQERRLWRHVESVEGFWESLNEIEPGAVARLATLATDRRWEIIFLTKRPDSAGATAQVQTQRWLQSKGFALPSVYVVQGSRGLVAAALALDFVVDDRPENCLDVVVDSKVRAILVWREDEQLLPAATRRLGIGAVKTVGECLDILAQTDFAPHEKPRVVDRVMKLLGLKSEAAL